MNMREDNILIDDTTVYVVTSFPGGANVYEAPLEQYLSFLDNAELVSRNTKG